MFVLYRNHNLVRRAGPVTGGDTRDFFTGPRGIGGPRRFENTLKREKYVHKNKRIYTTKRPLGGPMGS